MGSTGDRVAPTLSLHRSQLQHGRHLAGRMHADVGEDEQIELIIENPLQRLLRSLRLQREMSIGTDLCKTLAATILGIANVVTENLLGRVTDHGF